MIPGNWSITGPGKMPVTGENRWLIVGSWSFVDQTLILRAHKEFQGDFASSITILEGGNAKEHYKWATIDTTLWNLAFFGWGRSGLFNERNRDQGSPKYSNTSTQSLRQPPLYFKWKRDIHMNFSHCNCKFLHKCSNCI